jgi:hypothetical protein
MKIFRLFIAFRLVCFALSPSTQAIVPAPDGCYPNFTTAEGCDALKFLTTGAGNTALGWRSLFLNSANSFNTAIGAGTLLVNTADQNTAIGAGALLSNTTGADNTAIGTFALLNNTTGSFNTVIGANALPNNTTGRDIIALGALAGQLVTAATNVICIGEGGANVDNSCFIGNIRDITTQFADAIPVVIDSAGQLGTFSSSRRFKTDIKPMDKTSESILALKPVSFRYKVHKDKTPQFGLIAEEVAEVNPNLVIYDANGKPYTVRYEAVNAMLLNEFLKEHKKVEQLQTTVTQQQKDFQAAIAKLKETVTAQLNDQAAQIQKVSAQLAAASPSDGRLELNKAAPQTVKNND